MAKAAANLTKQWNLRSSCQIAAINNWLKFRIFRNFWEISREIQQYLDLCEISQNIFGNIWRNLELCFQ